MVSGAKYYTLIGSLPALPRSFEQADRAPLSPIQLGERLSMLEPHDAEVVERMEGFLVWERQPLERTDSDVLHKYDQFMSQVESRFARDLIREAMAMRTILAGLRCRRMGREPPLGVEPLASQVSRNWNHPDFRLAGRFPWISEVEQQLNGPEPFEVERMKLRIAWRHVSRLAGVYHFEFEAVLLYLFRWEIIYRWTQRNAEAGREKLELLISQAMGPYANLFDGAGEEQ